MNINIVSKKCLQKLYVFYNGDEPVPIYLTQADDIDKMTSGALKKKLAKTREIIKKGSKGRQQKATLNEYQLSSMLWYELDGKPVPFNEYCIQNREIIDRLVQKILKSSTYPKTKFFLFDLIKQLIRGEKWSMKQKFLAVCKAYSVSDFPFQKKKPSQISQNDIGMLKGVAQTDLMPTYGVYPIKKTDTRRIKQGSDVFVWKIGKYWTVFDPKNDVGYRLKHDVVNNNVTIKEMTDEGAGAFAIVQNIMLSKEFQDEKETQE